MTQFLKSQLNQIMFPMVDKTDFASIESGITASDFNSAATKKWFGVNHAGSAAFASGTISKATELVTSGLFKQTLKSGECGYDYNMYVFRHASCADQILIFQTEDIDLSDIDSQLNVTHSLLSDVESQVDLLVTSDALSAIYSDLTSKIANISATIDYSDISDIASAVWADAIGSDVLSRIIVIQGDVSNIESIVESLTATITASDMSDIASRVWATAIGTQVDSRILVLQSNLSDVESQVDLLGTSNYLSAIHSDLASAIGGVTATVTASDMSDIASRVWATTIGTRVDSRILVLQSNLSDVESQVDLLATSNYLSAVHSDIASAVGAVAATITASDMSDIASRVWATTEGARVDSRILVLQSNLSDVDSQLTANYNLISDVDSQLLLNASLISDVDSQLQLVATSAYLSDVQSNLLSYLAGMSGAISDVDSQLTANYDLISDVDSQVLLNASAISDVDSQLTVNYNLISDVDSQLLLNASNISDIDSQLTIEASRLSDIYSLMGDVDSQLLLNASMVSDIDSQIDAGVTIGTSSLSDISSRVNVEVLDVVATDTMAEITGIADVPATPTMKQGLMLLYQWLRNDTQATATERRVLNDAGTEVLDATMSDDGTTFSQGKLTAA